MDSFHNSSINNLRTKPQPYPISVGEMRLVQMETGNASWDTLTMEESAPPPREQQQLQQQQQQQSRLLLAYPGRAVPMEDNKKSDDTSDSDDRDDPRKSIIHKRSDLTLSADSASSLQSSINFSELKLQEVIGGGGFGRVWKAMWRGTPVAVKVLTGTSQSKKVSKAILEEFAVRKSIFSRACVIPTCSEPPNRAVVTELAANGSVWDALRLPLAPPSLLHRHYKLSPYSRAKWTKITCIYFDMKYPHTCKRKILPTSLLLHLVATDKSTTGLFNALS